MAERHRAAVDVDLFAVEIEIADELFSDHGKGFVDFPDVDVVRGQPGLFEHLFRRGDRGVEHQRRVVADIGVGDDAGTRFQAMLVGVFFRREQDGGRAINDARAITRVMEMLDLDIGIAAVDLFAESKAAAEVEVGEAGEGGLERRQPFGSGFGAREFFMVERDAAVGIQKRPSLIARSARCWLTSASASSASRLMPSIVAMASPHTP
jgi:hypothetical protein